MMTRRSSPGFVLVLAPIALLAACGDSEGADLLPTDGAATTASPVLSPQARLSAATDQSWINLSGRVVTTAPNSFVLDYGEDTITVEMDDWDWFREGQALAPGDPVVVTGKVDDDLWQSKRIEASSVYAKNLNTYYFASGADEEDLIESTVYVPPIPASSDSTGYVSSVEGQEFTIGLGTTAIRVDTSTLAASARPPVKVGDRVYVWGDLDLDPREGTEIMAKGIVLLARDRTKISGERTSQTTDAEGNMATGAPVDDRPPANGASSQP